MRKIFSLLAGFAALVWFLIRVIPKPSRAAYPCQRAAFPLASGFVIWMVGLFCFKGLHRRSRYAVGASVVALAALVAWLPLGVSTDAIAQSGPVPTLFTPSEPPKPGP